MAATLIPDPTMAAIKVKVDRDTESILRDLAAANQVKVSVVIRKAIAIGLEELTK